MQPLCVVNIVNEVIDASAGIGDGLEGPRIQFLGLERLHETFRLGVIVWIAGPRHRDGDVMISEALPVVDGSVLDAAVGVMDEASSRRPAGFKRLIECGHGQ